MKVGYYFLISNQYTLNRIKLYEFGFCRNEDDFEDLCVKKFKRVEKLNSFSLEDINLDLSERIGEVVLARRCEEEYLMLFAFKTIQCNGGEYNGK